MGKHIMLDLETASTRPNAAIIAIGAVWFNPYEYDAGFEPTEKIPSRQAKLRAENKTFYAGVSLGSSVNAGLHIDQATIEWWLKQDDKARNMAFEEPCTNLRFALEQFSEKVEPDDTLWGNAAMFDNIILQSAYQALDMPFPFKYQDHMCYRTLRKMMGQLPIGEPPMDCVGTYHNALDDAVNQAVHCQKMYHSFTTAFNGFKV